MSDIHGHFDEFRQMLDQIEFSERDELILAGDYVDRGTQTLEMLYWIEQCPENVLLLKGNHDAEFAECINILDGLNRSNGLDETVLADTQKLYKAIRRIPEIQAVYFDYYGTIENLIMDKAVTLAELKRWAALIKGMPFVYKRTVNGKKYIIVHAGYYEDDSVSSDRLEQFYIYAREEAGGEVYRLYDKKKDCTFYDIDCGCGYKESDRFQNCRLACIRLEDEQVFYV